MEKIGRYEFRANPFHCDCTGHLFMGHLGNHMLNAADFHANDRDFGIKYLQTINKAWVLSRLAIEMEEMPQIYERFYVESWIESSMKFFTNRCFRVVNTDGKVYGHGKSIWAMIDTETRQPCNLLDIKDGELLQWELKDEPNPMGKMTRVMMSHEAEQIKSIETGYHDVDINGHINSVKFIEHVMDLWETEWYCKHRLKRVDVAYVAEGHKGDKLELYREQTGEMEFCVRVCRAGADETELCRMKLVFEN